MDVSEVEVTNWAEKNNQLSDFIDDNYAIENYRDGVFLLKKDETKYEVKVCQNGECGSIGDFTDLKDAVLIKLKNMRILHFISFKST